MSCELDLEGYVFGELAPAQHERARAHLGACVACAHQAGQLRSERRMFSARQARTPGFDLTRLREAVEAQTQRRQVKRAVARKSLAMATLLSAASLIAVLVSTTELPDTMRVDSAVAPAMCASASQPALSIAACWGAPASADVCL